MTRTIALLLLLGFTLPLCAEEVDEDQWGA